MRLLTISTLILALTACVQDVGEGKVKAKVENAPAAAVEAAAKAAPAASDVYAVDPAQSSIKALGAKVTATHPIDFKSFKGKVAFDGDKPNKVTFEVAMDSMEADHPKLTTHLLNADFFDVEKYPTAGFASTEIKEGSDEEGYAYTVTGVFGIHGVQKQLTFPANFAKTDTGVKANTEFVINRQDFGIAYPGRPDDLIQDNVRMTISFVAAKG